MNFPSSGSFIEGEEVEDVFHGAEKRYIPSKWLEVQEKVKYTSLLNRSSVPNNLILSRFGSSVRPAQLVPSEKVNIRNSIPPSEPAAIAANASMSQVASTSRSKGRLGPVSQSWGQGKSSSSWHTRSMLNVSLFSTSKCSLLRTQSANKSSRPHSALPLLHSEEITAKVVGLMNEVEAISQQPESEVIAESESSVFVTDLIAQDKDISQDRGVSNRPETAGISKRNNTNPPGRGRPLTAHGKLEGRKSNRYHPSIAMFKNLIFNI